MDPRVFHKVSYGVYAVGSREPGSEGRASAQIANTVTQVSAHPEQVAVAIHKENFTHGLIAASGVFGACILDREAPLDHIGRFGFRSGRDGDKLEGIEWRRGRTGSPIVIPHSVGAIEVEVQGSIDAVTHTLFVGKVVTTEMLGGGTPLTYEHYHLVRRGKSPARAPVSQVDEPAGASAQAPAAARHRCTVCGYVHDEAASGQAFAGLAEDWRCPVCGSPRSVFEPV